VDNAAVPQERTGAQEGARQECTTRVRSRSPSILVVVLVQPDLTTVRSAIDRMLAEQRMTKPRRVHVCIICSLWS
jgi:chromosomal replication initiation ATPase DnaA